MTKFDQRLIGFITTFETLTHCYVKDAYIDRNEILVFIVKEGHMGKVLGKGGSTIRRVTRIMKRKIKVIEYNPDVTLFIKNILNPLKPDEIVVESGYVTITAKISQTKALILGRNRRNLQDLANLVKKYFKLDVKVT